MTLPIAIRGRVALAALSAIVAASLLAPAPAFASPESAASDGPTSLRLTERDVTASNQKAAAAYGALVGMWTRAFDAVGATFVPPHLVRYRSTAATACGLIAPSNASYCPDANTIFFDDVFVATQGKIAGQALGSDGDMAALGIIAHEMGHAVALQIGHWSRASYENESVADCLAGAFAHQANLDGSLEPGDVEEAVYGMASAGDPTPQPTGNARADARLARLVARNAHGTREQRVQNFRAGLAGGGAACLAELRS